MTDIPGSGTFRTNNALTQGGLRSAHEDIRDYLTETPWGGAAIAAGLGATISAGAISPVAKEARFIYLVPEGAPGVTTDDLVTISTTNIPLGGWLVLTVAAPNYAVTLKTSGNIRLSYADTEYIINAVEQGIVLRRDGSNMREIFRFGMEDKRPLTLSAGFTNGNPAVRGWKDAHAYVQIEGKAQYNNGNLAIDQQICILPGAFTPSATDIYVPVVSFPFAVHPVKIGPFGPTNAEVRWEGPVLNNPLIDLSSIRYRTDP